MRTGSEVYNSLCNPVGRLRREAEAAGLRLSGMAYTVGNNLAFVQQIAKSALSADHSGEPGTAE